jgi:single-strand DNA-binding protein
MLNLNKAMIIGNATRDPELRTTPNGRSVASFAVATNRRYTDGSGEQREEVQYHEIVAWGKLAEIVNQYIQKGSKVYVEGRIQTRHWEGQDGNRRERTEIIADNIINLSPRTGGSDYSETKSNTDSDNKDSEDKNDKKKDSIEDEINLDDIPF